MKKITFTLLISLVLMGTSAVSQVVPNASFESWSRDTVDIFGFPIMFDHPDEWYPLASLFYAMSGMGDIGLMQSADHHGAGSSSALFEISPTAFGADIFTAFPVSQLPTSLTGYYKFDGTGSEPANVSVLFTRYDSGGDSAIIVAQGAISLNNTVSSFTQFIADIIPEGTGTPDTCYVMISYMIMPVNTTPVRNTTKFWIDNLSFQGTSGISRAGIPEITLSQDQTASWVSLEWKAEVGTDYSVEIYSLTGKLIERQEKVKGRATFSTASFPKGLYIIRLSDGQKATARKFVI